MMQFYPLIIQVQHAGYESLLVILLILAWGTYRYYKSTKTIGIPDETPDDETSVPDYDIPEAKAVFREPVLYEEGNSAISRSSDPIAVTLSDTFADYSDDQQENSAELSDFDPRKAVVWSEILKRPYC